MGVSERGIVTISRPFWSTLLFNAFVDQSPFTSLLGRVPGCHLAGAQCFRKLTSGQCWTHLSSALPDFGQTRTSMSIFGGSYRLQSRLGLSGLQGKLCSEAHPFILLQQCRCSIVGFRPAAGSAESSVFSAGRGSRVTLSILCG